MEKVIMLCDGSRMVVQMGTPEFHVEAAERIIIKKTFDIELCLLNERPNNEEIIRRVGRILNQEY